MSSSRSDDVTRCVSVSVGSVSFRAVKAFERRYFEGVIRVSQDCMFEVSRVFGSFKDVSRKVSGC